MCVCVSDALAHIFRIRQHGPLGLTFSVPKQYNWPVKKKCVQPSIGKSWGIGLWVACVFLFYKPGTVNSF